jgi:hypothetical protein
MSTCRTSPSLNKGTAAGGAGLELWSNPMITLILIAIFIAASCAAAAGLIASTQNDADSTRAMMPPEPQA